MTGLRQYLKERNIPMRKLISTTFLTLDGIMQAPGGPGEDESDGFKLGGWIGDRWDGMLDDVMGATLGRKPDLLLGRKTYDIFAGYWPHATEPGADELNNAQKYVVSRTLDKVDWQNTTLIKGEAVEEINKLKAMDGPELQVHGSSNLLQTLLKHGLVDEMQVIIFPVIVGKGKRLFGENLEAANFKLLNSRTSAKGVIVAWYEPAGAFKTAAIA
jgi:dihydrofolate reductase